MIIILTGPLHSGKTSLLKKTLRELKSQKFRVDGFLSEVVPQDKRTIGYDLFDLRDEEAMPFLRKRGEEGWPKAGSFFFVPYGLARAREIILRGRNADICAVDEVGPLELNGGGLWPALKQVIFQPQARYLLVVRQSILKDFLRMLDMEEVIILGVRNKKIASRIAEAIKRTG